MGSLFVLSLLSLLSVCVRAQDSLLPTYTPVDIPHSAGSNSLAIFGPDYTAQGCSVPDQTYAVPASAGSNSFTFDCPVGLELSGFLVPTYTCTSGVWYRQGGVQVPPPQCVVLDFTGCHSVTTTLWLTNKTYVSAEVGGLPQFSNRNVVPQVMVSQCAANEMVVAGGGTCLGSDSVYHSAPRTDLRGWVFGCELNIAIFSNIAQPVSATALCCPVASDTFVETPAFSPISSLQTPPASSNLPPQSFLQACSPASVAPGLSAHAPSYSFTSATGTTYSGTYVTCPNQKIPITGGGVCSGGSGVLESYAFYSNTSGLWQWRFMCVNNGGGLFFPFSTTPVSASAVCCLAVSGISLPSPTTSASTNYVSCANSGYQLLGYGFQTTPSTIVPWTGLITRAITVPSGGGAQSGIVSADTAVSAGAFCLPGISATAAARDVTCSVLEPSLGSVLYSHDGGASYASSSPLPLGTMGTLNCPPGFYINGSQTATCNSQGQFSPSLGECQRIDQTGCVTIQSALLGNELECPNDGQDWLVISGGIDCSRNGPSSGSTSPVGVYIGGSWPNTLDSWYAYCNDGSGDLDKPLTGYLTITCCPKHSSPIFETCEIVPVPNLIQIYADWGTDGQTDHADAPDGYFWLNFGNGCGGNAPASHRSAQWNGLQIADTERVTGLSLPTSYQSMCSDGQWRDDPPHDFFGLICETYCTPDNAQGIACKYPSGPWSTLGPHIGVFSSTDLRGYVECADGQSLMLTTPQGSALSSHAPSVFWDYSNFVGDYGPTWTSMSSNADVNWALHGNVQHMSNVICLPAPFMCSISNPVVAGPTTPTSTYGNSWPVDYTNTFSCPLGYGFTSALTAAIELNCLIDVGGTPEFSLPTCNAARCPSLQPFVNGTWSESEGVTGDISAPECSGGTFPVHSSYTCTGQSSINGVATSTWCATGESGCIRPPTMPCTVSNTPHLTIFTSVIDQYSFTLTFHAPDFSSIAPGSVPAGFNPANVDYRIDYLLLFPQISQLSSSNALEAGLLSSVTNTTTSWVINGSLSQSVYTTTVYNDVNRHIEGVLSLITVTPFVPKGLPNNVVGFNLQSTSVISKDLCGCDVFGNPDGHILNSAITQDFTTNNDLILSFLPQSLCGSNYKLTQFSPVSASYQDVRLPILQTYPADTANDCPFLTTYSSPIAQVNYSTTGRVQIYCIQQMPQQICEACDPIYQPPTSTDPGTVPNITQCLSFVPAQWFSLSGVISTPPSPTASVQSAVSGVTVTATIVDNNGNPRPISNAVVGATNQIISASTFSDISGAWSLQLASNLLTDQFYQIKVTPSRVDPLLVQQPNLVTYSASTSTVQGGVAGTPYTISVQPGSVVQLDDGSTRTIQTTNYTTITPSYTYNCPVAVYPTTLAPCANASTTGCVTLNYSQPASIPDDYNATAITDSRDSSQFPYGKAAQFDAANTTAFNQSAQAVAGIATNVTNLACTLANANSVLTTVLINTTSVTTITTTRHSGQAGITSSTGRTVVSVSTTTQQVIVRWLSWLNNNLTAPANNLSAPLSPGQALNLTLANQPRLITHQQRLVVGGVDALTGVAVPSAGLILVIPAGYPMGTANTSTFANATNFTSGAVSASTPNTTSLTYNSTVTKAVTLSTLNTPSQTGAILSLYLGLSNNVSLYAPLSQFVTTGATADLTAYAAGGASNVSSFVINLSQPTIVNVDRVSYTLFGGAHLTIFSPPFLTNTDAGVLYSAPIPQGSWATTASSLVSAAPNALPALLLNTTFTHSFTQEGSYPPSSSFIFPATHAQQVSGIHFDDLSEVAVQGQIRIHPNVNTPGIESCGQPYIIVTAYSPLDTSFVSPLGQSAPTQGDGTFTVSVRAQQAVVLVPSFYNSSLGTHTFNPSTVALTVGLTPITGLLFFDTTTTDLTLQIYGGGEQCAFPIGTVAPVLVVESCGGRHFTLGGFSSAAFTYAVPAIEYAMLSYSADPLDFSGLQLEAGMSPLYQQTINAWLVSNGAASLDLRYARASITLSYVNTTLIDVLPPTTPVQCSDSTTGEGFSIWRQGTSQFVQFSLYQQYGFGSGFSTCRNLNTSIYSVWMHDLINANSELDCAARGCQLATWYDGTRTLANYTTQVGDPFPFTRVGAPAYTRDLRFGLYNSLAEEANILHILVTGSVTYSGMGSIPYAPQNPLYILRDPPGGNSFASIQTVYTTNGVYTSSNTASQSAGLTLTAGNVDDVKVGLCAGFLIMTCVDVTDDKFSLSASAGLQTAFTETTADTSSITNSYTTTITTSTDQYIVGGDGDLFLLLTSSLDFSLAIVVDATVLSGGGCKVTPPYESLTWSTSPDHYITWVAQWDIVNRVIPQTNQAIENLLAVNGGSANFPPGSNDFQAWAALANSAAAWQSLLDYNNHLKLTAVADADVSSYLSFVDPLDSSGSSTPYQNLSNPNFLNGQTLISLYGDSGGLTFEMTTEVAKQSTFDFAAAFDITLGVDFSTQVEVAGVGIKAGFTVDGDIGYTHGFTTESTNTYSNTVQFTLQDPDQGDSMQVLVLKDTVFGSPVYILQSGFSRCLPEPATDYQSGTISRENVTMQFVQSTFSGLDPSAVGSTTLVLTNYAPLEETFPYYLNLNTETNSGGLQVSANGIPMTHNAVDLNLPYGNTYVSITWHRGPGTGYSFPGLTFHLSTDPVAGFCNAPFTVDSGPLSIEYVQPCNEVAWAGDLSYSNSFVVNIVNSQLFGTGGTHYVMVIKNPEAAIQGRAWEDSLNLLSMSAEFKGVNDNDAEWAPINTVDVSGQDAPFLPITNSQPGDIYAFYADVSSLEGLYDFRVRTQCSVPVNGGGNSALYSYSTPVVTGLIDHHYPALFGIPLPAVDASLGIAVYYPGSPIRATFTESIVCQSAHSQVQVFAWVVGSPNPSYAASPYQIQAQYICQTNTIDVAFLYPNWDLLIGQQVAVEVVGYTDLAGNPADPTEAPVTWSFQVAYFNVQQSLIAATGLSFSPSSISLAAAISAADNTSISTPSSSARRLLQTADSSSGSSFTAAGATPDSAFSPSTPLVPLITPADPVSSLVSSASTPSNNTVSTAIATELPIEVVMAIDLQRQYEGLSPSGYLPSQITITSQTAPSVTIGFNFLPSSSASSTMSSSAASHYFATALLNPALTSTLNNTKLFPLLAYSQLVQALSKNKTTSTPQQSYNFNLQLSVQSGQFSPLPPSGFVPAHGTTGPIIPSGGGGGSSIGPTAPLSSSNPSSVSLTPGTLTASVSFYLLLNQANAVLQGAVVSYAPVPDRQLIDPDVIAETLYPTTTVNTSTLPANSGQYYLYPTIAPSSSLSAFVLGLNSIPTQPGGMQYCFIVRDGNPAPDPQSGAVLFNQTLFVPGPPCAPQLLAATQTSVSTFQLAYLASNCNGVTLHSGNVNMTYQVTVTQPVDASAVSLTGTTVSVPPVALSPAYSPTPLSQVSLPSAVPTYCPPTIRYLTMALASQPGFNLPAYGGNATWNISLNTAVGPFASTQSTVSTLVSAVPAPVPILNVIPLALNQFAIYFNKPASAAPLLGYYVGYTYISSANPITDTIASNNITLTVSSQETTVVTIPFPQAPLPALFLSVQGYNVFGTSPVHLHQVFSPPYVAPPSSLSVVQLQGEGGPQSVSITWGASSLYLPSVAQALGYDVFSNSSTPVITLPTSSLSTVLSGLALSGLAYSIAVSTTMNSTNNPIKLCIPGAVLPVLSAPLQTVFWLTQLPVAPADLSVVQTGASTATATFYPSDYQHAGTGPATIQTYRASFLNGTVPAIAYNATGLPPLPTIPAQVLNGPNPAVQNSIALTGLPVSAVGTAPVLTFAVQGRNIAGFGYVGVLPIPLLGVPATPTVTLTQIGVSPITASLTYVIQLPGSAPPSTVYFSYSPQPTLQPVVTNTLTVAAILNQNTGVFTPSNLTGSLPSVAVPVGGEVLQLRLYGSNVAGMGPSGISTFAVASCPLAPASIAVTSVSPNLISVNFPVSANAGGASANIVSYTITWVLLATDSSINAATVTAGTGSVLLTPTSPNVTIAAGRVTAVIFSPTLLPPPPGPGYLFNFTLWAANQFGACPQSPNFVTVSTINFQTDTCCFAFSNPTYPVLPIPSASDISNAGQHNLQLTTDPMTLYNGASLSSLTAPTCYASTTTPIQWYDSGSEQWLSTYLGTDNRNHTIDMFVLQASGTGDHPHQQAYIALDTPLDSYTGTGGAKLFATLSGKPLRMNVQCNLACSGLGLGLCSYSWNNCLNSCAAFSMGTAPSFNVSYTSAENANCAAHITDATTSNCPWPGWFC